MAAVYLILMVVGLAIQNCMKKSYGVKVTNGAFLFPAMSITVAALCSIVVAGGVFNFTWEVVPYSIAFAVSYGLAVLFSFMALQSGPMALSVLISSYSLLIPTFYGIIALDETLGVTGIVGIVLLSISLFFSNYKKKNEKTQTKITLKWIIYVIIAFVFNGTCSTVQKVQQVGMNGEQKNEFMFLAYSIAAVALLIVCLIKERKTIPTNFKRGWIFFTTCGIFNAVVNFSVMFCAPLMPASIMFPIISGGNTLASIAVAVLIYKERLTKFQTIGIAFGLSSIILLNI